MLLLGDLRAARAFLLRRTGTAIPPLACFGDCETVACFNDTHEQ